MSKRRFKVYIEWDETVRHSAAFEVDSEAVDEHSLAGELCNGKWLRLLPRTPGTDGPGLNEDQRPSGEVMLSHKMELDQIELDSVDCSELEE